HPATRIQLALSGTRGAERGEQYARRRQGLPARGRRDSRPHARRAVSLERRQPCPQRPQTRRHSRRGGARLPETIACVTHSLLAQGPVPAALRADGFGSITIPLSEPWAPLSFEVFRTSDFPTSDHPS